MDSIAKSSPSRRPYLLCVLDGFGLNPNPVANAVKMARTPHFTQLSAQHAFTTLTTHGECVGLPGGQMGNSEVGHLNIGAGRIVEQWLLRISKGFENDALGKIPAYQNFCAKLTPASRIHVAGLWSDGGVHSHSEHLYLLLKQLHRNFSGEIILHLITDGRDTSPHRAGEQLEELDALLAKLPRVTIATVSGRYFAMDRDKRWDRLEKAFRVITAAPDTLSAPSARHAIFSSYEKGITDEFIEPVTIKRVPIGPDDAFVFFNFREDRARQIVASLCSPTFDGFARTGSFPHGAPFAAARSLCFTDYDEKLRLPVLFESVEISNHLGAVVSAAGLSQLRTAETEKYPHVTYFLNGGIEKPYPGEDRRMVPSPRDVATYDLKPEMSAAAVTDIVVQAIEGRTHDLIVVNLANCDMVGHTGVLEAAIRAVETVDSCLGRMIAALKQAGGAAVILADHGNAEQMINYETGAPHTAHTTFPVPCIVIGAPVDATPPTTLRNGGALCDIAPTVLKLMGIKQPPEMTGAPLF